MANLVFYPDPRLRVRAEAVGEITDEVRQVVEDIFRTMEEHGAVGLSACHIGVPLRILTIYNRVYINPKLSDPSSEKEVGEEGSISLPGVRLEVERPKSITIEAIDLEGNLVKERLEGFEARIAMHENDQINGVFFLQRVPKSMRPPQWR